MKLLEQLTFEIIAAAGDSFSLLIEAMKFAREGDFEKAEMKVKEADEILVKAHRLQTDLIVKETRGERMEFSTLLVHAQDHLMNAMLAKPFVLEIINLYKKMESKREE